MWEQPGRERRRAERGEPLLRSAVPPELYPGANQRDGSVQIVRAKTFRPRFQPSGVAAQACPTSRLWCGASRRGARRARRSVIYHLDSLIWPIEMRDLRSMVAVDHKRRRDHLRFGWVQEPQQEHTMQSRRAHRGQGIAAIIGLSARKHSNDTIH